MPAKFDGQPAALILWLFDIEQYCELVGIAISTEMVKLVELSLEKDAYTWWWYLNNHGVSYSLGHLGWQDFKSELVDAFNDLDCEAKLYCKLQSLKQQASVAQYVKEFKKVTLKLGD